MFSLKKRNEVEQYLYMIPVSENTARWEVITDEELDKMIEENSMVEGCKLFKVEKEIKVSFQRVTNLD